MKKAMACFLVLLCAFSCVSYTEDLNVVMDQFYNGLAAIIERNMENPDNCVREVEKYYENNQDTIAKVRVLTEKQMSQAMAMADKYEAMAELEELKNLENMEEFERTTREMEMMRPGMLPGAGRYASAMESFAVKYPRQGLVIAGKATQFIPKSQGE